MMKKLMYVLLAIATLSSCKKEKDEKEQEVVNTEKTYLQGKYAVNEGSFGNNNASVSYISNDGELINDIYLQKNSTELGDVLQSFTVVGEKGYAVLNNSHRIEVVDMKTMQHNTSITGIDYPRYLLNVGNGKAYVTDGSNAGNVRILDINSNQFIGSIPVGNGPERMVRYDHFVYVCNSGGWGLDNTVSVIDLNTNSVASTIEVGDRPMDIVSDVHGDIWVLCSGNDSWMEGGETSATLYRINSQSQQVEAQSSIGGSGLHPKNIASNADGSVLYYESNGIYSINLLADEPEPILFLSGSIGSLDVDPSNGDVWIASTPDFVNPSTLKKYSALGEVKATYEVGIGTNAVVFN